MQKIYLAEVVGNFSHEEVACSEPLSFHVKGKRSHIDHDDGKEAHTDFRKMHYNQATDTTIVEARPRTGRQHQIRVHLAHLGHPILDDPTYGTPPIRKQPDMTHSLTHPLVPHGKEILEKGQELGCIDCPNLYPASFKSYVQPIHLHALRYEGEDFSYETKPPSWAVYE